MFSHRTLRHNPVSTRRRFCRYHIDCRSDRSAATDQAFASKKINALLNLKGHSVASLTSIGKDGAVYPPMERRTNASWTHLILFQSIWSRPSSSNSSLSKALSLLSPFSILPPGTAHLFANKWLSGYWSNSKWFCHSMKQATTSIPEQKSAGFSLKKIHVKDFITFHGKVKMIVFTVFHATSATS